MAHRDQRAAIILGLRFFEGILQAVTHHNDKLRDSIRMRDRESSRSNGKIHPSKRKRGSQAAEQDFRKYYLLLSSEKRSLMRFRQGINTSKHPSFMQIQSETVMTW
jgi:hypothetical protein